MQPYCEVLDHSTLYVNMQTHTHILHIGSKYILISDPGTTKDGEYYSVISRTGVHIRCGQKKYQFAFTCCTNGAGC